MRAPTGYRLGKPYGKDKTGVLYRAVQTKLDRTVTIKALREELSDHAIARRLFLAERDLVAQLDHAHLLGTLDTGEVDAIPYVVTESTLQTTLAHQLRAGEPLEELLAVRIALGIARALDYLNQHKLIYKNLKPTHVLTPRPHVPKLITFRHVRSISEAPSFFGANVQTGAYCAPELTRPGLGSVSVRSNVYALGGLLYHMFAGKPPVAGDSATCRAAHASGEIPPLRDARPYLRDRAHAIVEQFMKFEPAERSNARAAVGLLEAYLDDPLVKRPLVAKKKRRRRR